MLLATLGHWLILLAMLGCALNIGVTAFSYHPAAQAKGLAWRESAHNAAFVTWAFVASACALLVFAFATNNFALAYVWEHSSRAQPLPFKLSALWGGQGGSMLLWTFVLATYGFLVSRGGRKSGEALSPIATSVICATTLFFAALVAFVASPWALMEQVPQDGRGMTPLLQNYWMQIHPPTLYVGYVGCTVPFAFAVAALFLRKFDAAWVALIRRWVLFTWIVLTIGIVLGGVWAYETLGWGGYWGWDPVENASLMPWLAATAFLHSIMLQGRRGLLKNWNIALVTLTFLLSIFGTFLTRSGIVDSVHAFAKSDMIGNYFLAFIGLAFVGTGALILWRRADLQPDARIESPLSREGAFMLNNYLLLGCTLAVLLGTVYPTMSQTLGNVRVNVSASYFNSVMAPLGLMLLSLTGVGPLLGWRKTTPAGMWRVLKFPVLWSLAFSPLLWFLGQWRTGAATAFTLAFFVFLAIGWEFARGIKALRAKNCSTVLDAGAELVSFNPARYGGYIVHLGVAIMFIGITGSSLFKVETQSILLHKGESMRVKDGNRDSEYVLRFDGLERPEKMPEQLSDQISARIAVFDANGQVTSDARPMRPHMDYFVQQTTDATAKKEENPPVQRPSIRSTPANDLYLVMTGFDTKQNSVLLKAYMNPLVMWIWISQAFFILGTLIAFLPPRRVNRAQSRVAERSVEREKELVA